MMSLDVADRTCKPIDPKMLDQTRRQPRCLARLSMTRPSNIYDDKQLKLLINYENNVKNATSLKTQFENWYLAMPVLSFNGSKYDINFTKQYLHKS